MYCDIDKESKDVPGGEWVHLLVFGKTEQKRTALTCDASFLLPNRGICVLLNFCSVHSFKEMFTSFRDSSHSNRQNIF
jgi:hypothetical protein